MPDFPQLPVAELERLGLVTDATLTRRRFVGAAAVTAGFAMCVQPIQAQTRIITPADGLDARDIEVPHAGRNVRAYWAAPQGNGPFPFVLVIHEIFGMHEYIKDVTRRFAKLGYAAIVIDHWHQAGDVTQLGSIDEIRKAVIGIKDSDVLATHATAVAFAKSTGKADLNRMGVTGFCGGGRYTWLNCAANPSIRAGVAWYGHLDGQRNEQTPRHPIDMARELKVPMLGLYSGVDPGIPNDLVERMRTALKEAGVKSEIIIYPDAPHGFHGDYRPTYREAAAKDGWDRLVAWFKQNGAA